MRSLRVFVATALFGLSAVASFGACLPITATSLPGFGGYRLSWQPVAGATNYEVQASADNFQHVTSVLNLPAGSTGATVNELTSVLAQYSFRIVASNPSNPSDVPCSGTVTNYFGANETFHDRVNRTVFPVVGSTRGLNNASFKTSLRLGPASTSSAGKIIFHPAGRAGSDDDPSIPYRVERGQTLQFDDVVAAIGQSGIGSLDILQTFPFVRPETTPVPAEVRLFNEASGGTYGTFESPVLPTDAFRPIDWNIFVPSSRFRVNIGIRTLTQVHVSFFLIAADGNITEKVVDYAPDYIFLQAADQFFGKPVNPGDSIVVNMTGDNVIAIPFHTFTDNSTNDPAVFNPQSPAHLTFPVLAVPSATP
ncbi:MAG: fibronectin type III domain-containing protein [Acidobacteria bacterium]|nr:fibronectin type III domain-containing protein [Acidobacteriota bacterium]MBV9070497.1 fibronectin type III domain-containing protein [Acidobacteriota bacterium]MBV9188330.1 fibronectin type III domain-containing protein [Acidobacteriota bacterium]